MAGWRVGMVVGHQTYLDAILKVKSNMDSGMYYGIQQGAIEALKSSADWFEHMNGIYDKRRKIIWDICNALGYQYSKESSGLFVWARIPLDKTSEETTDHLLYKHDVFVTPGTVFGKQGEGYIRFSLCVDESKMLEVLRRVSKKART
jgi:aspartate/methionine/tyrosine aminotransferase